MLRDTNLSEGQDNATQRDCSLQRAIEGSEKGASVNSIVRSPTSEWEKHPTKCAKVSELREGAESNTLEIRRFRMRTKTLFLSGQRLLREGFEIAFADHPEIEFLRPAADTDEAIDRIRVGKPEVIVVDLNPCLFGLRVAKQLQIACPECKILILMSHADAIGEMQLLLAGVKGVLSKNVGLQDIAWSVREIVAGKIVFVQDGRLVAKEMLSPNSSSSLTPRESQVLELVAHGYANKQVAAELGISIKTVEKHRQRVMYKLQAHETAGLTSRAICLGVAPANGVYPFVVSYPN